MGVMKTSQRGIDLIRKHEGLRMRAYLCPAGVWTIGYGHTFGAGPPVVAKGMSVSVDEANAILVSDLAKFEAAVARLVKVALTQHQFDALVSFAFNVGQGALAKSTLLKRLNAGRHDAVPAELMKWTKGGGKVLPGLVNRRRDEAALWRSISPIETSGAQDGPVDPPAPPKSMAQSKTGNTAIGIGASSAVIAMTQADDGAKAVRSISDSIGVPVLLIIAVALMAGAAFIWWDRRRKLVEDGV